MKCQKKLFSLSDEVTYLNCAYMSPMLKTVEEAGIAGIHAKRTPSKVTPQHFFDPAQELRALFAKLVNAPSPDRIVIIPSVSYGIATVCKNIRLKKGQKVIVLDEQFPSNYYPWKRLCDEQSGDLKIIERPQSGGVGQDWNAHILAAIDDDTAVVAMCHVHWADGTLFDLKAIRKKTKQVGALLIIDGTQSVGALPFDIDEIAPDALICAAYKWLLGPYAIGLAYYGEAFDHGVPIEENWMNRYESENFAGLVNYNDQYQPGALRYEVGEHSNFILLPMITAALQQIDYWGVRNIQRYCQQLFEPYVDPLKEAGFILEAEAYRSAHLFGIRSSDTEKMTTAKSILNENNISVSVRGDAIRVSPHVYNDSADIDSFVTTLTSI